MNISTQAVRLVLFIMRGSMKKALIITGGYINFNKIDINSDLYDLIIAADSGYISAEKLKILPNIIVGDFDSSKKPNINTKIVSFPTEKDETDTMIACNMAIDDGCEDLTIVGGTGGRIDHLLSNVFSLECLKAKGINSVLTDGENEITVLKNETVSISSKNKYFSIFSIGECKVTLSGCKYPLTEYTLPRYNPSYAVSNEVIDEYATVSVSGTAFLCKCIK